MRTAFSTLDSLFQSMNVATVCGKDLLLHTARLVFVILLFPCIIQMLLWLMGLL